MTRTSQWFVAMAILFVAAPGLADAPAGRFSASGGVVTDSKTGLAWQQADGGQTYWNAAVTQCNQLQLMGGGWRLPTARELSTLVDDSVGKFDPIFTGSGDVGYWSASVLASGSTFAWEVGSNGFVDHYSKSNNNHVLCVR